MLQGWLVGPSEIIDVDPELLDPDARPGWGNAPSGWVPGMVLSTVEEEEEEEEEGLYLHVLIGCIILLTLPIALELLP